MIYGIQRVHNSYLLLTMMFMVPKMRRKQKDLASCIGSSTCTGDPHGASNPTDLLRVLAPR